MVHAWFHCPINWRRELIMQKLLICWKALVIISKSVTYAGIAFLRVAYVWRSCFIIHVSKTHLNYLLYEILVAKPQRSIHYQRLKSIVILNFNGFRSNRNSWAWLQGRASTQGYFFHHWDFVVVASHFWQRPHALGSYRLVE